MIAMNENLFEMAKFDKIELLREIDDAEYLDSLHDSS